MKSTRKRAPYSPVQRAVASGALAFFSVTFLVPASYAEATQEARAAAARDAVLVSAFPLPGIVPAVVELPQTPDAAADRDSGDPVLGAGTGSDRFFVHHAPDPVNAKNANMFLPQVDLVIPGPGFDLRVARTYNSRSTLSGPFGHGWSYNYDVTIAADAQGNLRVTDPDGFVSTFSKDGLNAEQARARVAREIATEMRAENESRGQTHDDDFYDRLFERLRVDESFFRDHRDRYATGADVEEGVYWNADRGVQKVIARGDGFVRFTTDGVAQVFDAEGRLERATDRNGNFVKLSYDVKGHLQTVSDRAGRSLRFESDGNGRITSVKDPIGRELHYRYDPRGNLVSARGLDGEKTRYAYDADHNMTRVTYPGGASSVMTYDVRRDWVLSQAGPGPKRTTFEYGEDPANPRRLRTVIKDSLGGETVYEYDDANNSVSRTDPLGLTTTTEYSSAYGKPVKEIDPLGRETEYAYDKLGDLIGIRDPAGNVTRIRYEGRFGKVRSKTAPDGTEVRIRYDARGNAAEVRSSYGQRRVFTYDAMGNVTSVTETNGAVTRIAWDDGANPKAITDAEGNTTKLVYDRVGRLQSVEDPRGGVTRYTFDDANRLVKVVDAADRVSKMSYDAAGHRISTVDPRGAVTRFEFNELGQRTGVIRADGSRIAYDYDPLGRVRRVRDPLGSVWKYDYDAAGRMTSATDPKGNATAYDYDPAGRLASVVRANGARTTYQYDELDRVVRAVDPANGVARFEYDLRGALTSVRNQLGASSRFQYDAAGRLTKMIDATGKSKSFTYDSVGRRTSFTDTDGRVTRYGWDSNNRLVAVRDADGERRWGFDAGGNMVSYAESIGENQRALSMAYDAVGRMVAMKGPNGGSIKRTYDKLSNLASVTDPAGNRTTFLYDAMGRLTEMTDANLDSTKIAYDAAGNVATVLDPKGLLTRHQYDELGRRSRTSIGKETYGFAYDSMGNTTSVVGPGGGRTLLAYDPMGRLTGITGANGERGSYEYDPAGQLVSAPMAVGSGSRTATFGYDPAGRMSSINGRALPQARPVPSTRAATSAVGGDARGTSRSGQAAALPNASAGAPGSGSATSSSHAASTGIPSDGALGSGRGIPSGSVGPVATGPDGSVSTPGAETPGSSSAASTNAGAGGSFADPLGGITITPNADGSFDIDLPLGDGGGSVYLTVGPNGVTGGGANYSFPLPGNTVGTVGVGYDSTNGLSFGAGLQLPGGLGSIDVSISENGTVMVGGSVAIPLGNGGSLVLNPAITYGPDGLQWGGMVDLDIPGVGTFSVGFFENEFTFADTEFAIPLPGGGLLEMDGSLVNGADGLELTGMGSVTMGGGLGSLDFAYGYLDGEPYFQSEGNIAIPLEGGGFLDLPLNLDFGPYGMSFSNDGDLSIPLGNGNYLNVMGTMENGFPMIGLNDFCITCFLFDEI